MNSSSLLKSGKEFKDFQLKTIQKCVVVLQGFKFSVLKNKCGEMREN